MSLRSFFSGGRLSAVVFVLAAGCQHEPGQVLLPFADARLEGYHDSHGESDPVLDGRSATYSVPGRRLYSERIPHYTAYSEYGFEPGYGSYERSGEVYTESLYVDGAHFLEPADDEVRPDAPVLSFDVSASHGQVPGSGGVIWVRAAVSAPATATPRIGGLNVTVLCDLSESMAAGQKLDLLRRAVSAIVAQLVPSDRVSIVAFDHAAHVLVASRDASDTSPFASAIGSLAPTSGENLGAGLYAAYEECRQGRETLPQAGGLVVLLSDGRLDGSWRAASLARQMRAQGYRLSAIALGDDVDPTTLAPLVEAGEGRLASIADVRDVDAVVSREMRRTLEVAATGLRLRVDPGMAKVVSSFGDMLRGGDSRRATEFELSDLGTGDSRSVLLQIRVPPQSSSAPVPLSFELFFKQENPVRRTTLTRSLLVRVGSEYTEADPAIESRAALERGFDALERALRGEGDEWIRETLRVRDEHAAGARAIASLHGDLELERLAREFDHFAERLRRLADPTAPAADDEWSRLARDVWFR